MNLLDSAFQAIFSISWRTACVVMALAVLRSLARGWISARLWYAAWLIVALRLLIPVSVPLAWSPFNLGKLLSLNHAPVPIAIGLALAAGSGGADLSRTLPASPSFPPTLAALWIAGTMVLLAARFLAWAGFRRRLRASQSPADSRLVAAVEWCGSTLGIARGPSVSETIAVDGPALFGIIRPQLLFPPGMADTLTGAELHLVVLHELGHWRRRDLLSQALIQGICALHWFNPLIWMGARLARQDCEFACDEFVLGAASPRATQEYGAVLLKVLGAMRSSLRPAPLLGILENRTQLKRRLQMIIDYKNPSLARTIAGAILLAVLGSICLICETRAQSPAVEKTPAKSVPATNVVTITIKADGGLGFNDKEIENDQLLPLLRQVDKATPILIRADESTPVKRAAFVWDACNKAGLDKFSMQTDATPVADMFGSVSIQGAVKNPGRFELPGGNPQSVVDLVVRAGGFTDVANAGDVRITHANGAGDNTNLQQVDVRGIIRGHSDLKADDKSLLLLPGDIVYVPEKRI